MSTVDETGGAVEHEPKAREARAYAVLIGALVTEVPEDGEPVKVPGAAWTSVGSVKALNRAGAVEAAEEAWPEELARPDVVVHLVPERFWQPVTQEEEPPPPRRRWAGV